MNDTLLLEDVMNLLSALCCVLDGTMDYNQILTLEGLRANLYNIDYTDEVLIRIINHIQDIGILNNVLY